MTPEPRATGQIEVGELRERLRALGYLSAGVDRFVLAPAGQQGSAVALASRVSLRIGLLAALLLGPAAAIGVALRLPGLIAGARDAVVVVLYLAVIFGGATACASFIAAIIVTLLARRANARYARRIGLGAGWLVGIGCLVYLTLWWNATGAAWSEPTRTLVAIAAAVAISLVLGHTVSIATLALLARESPRASAIAPAFASRKMLATGILAFAIVAGLLATSLVRGQSTPQSTADFAIVPTGVRVLIVGIDGYDPGLFAKWREQGVTAAAPILQRLTIRAQADGATDPAATWTTVATGVPPGRHGVVGLQSRQVVGLRGVIDPRSSLAAALGGATDLLRLTRPAPVSGFARQYKMLWEVAADKGLSAAVVNWWATWPASGTRAVVLSDRAVLRLETGGEQSAEIAPPALYPPLRHRWPEIRKQAGDLANRLSWLPDRTAAEIMARSAKLDAEQALLARDPLLGSPDLLAVYLPGLDIAQHELLQGADARITSPSVVADRLAALPSYYYFLDQLIREQLLRDLPRDTVVIVVAHPGRVRGVQGAVLSMGGGPVRDAGAGSTAPRSIMDVAPTVLYLLGMPVSREFAGKPWLDRLDPEFVRRYPVRFVETYGAYAAELPASEGRSLDRETLERLRSLGYIR